MQQQWIDWQGQTIDGKFELRRYLGESELSGVFLTAIGSPQSRDMAIKIVPASSQNAENEVSHWNSLENLSHPHLIGLFGAGTCEIAGTNYSYVVMDYAEENLEVILASRSLTPAEAQEMLGPMVDALTYLHSCGFVHGHLKPSNVMAVGDQLKISSDGILKTGDASPEASAYLPPEAATGQASPSWDVWSLGITLLESLTQQRPVIRSESDVEDAVRALPAPFQTIVRRGVRIEPQQRATLANIQNELRSPAQAVEKMVAPQSRTEHLSNQLPVNAAGQPTRNRLLVLAAIIVLLAAVAGAFLIKRGDSKAAPSEVVAQPPTTLESTPPIPPQSNTDATQPGKIVRQVMPEVPAGALRTIHGTVKVKVKVHVDAAGEVQKVMIVSGAGNRYFANKSVEASKRWTFSAPTVDGKSVASQWEVEFQFNRAAVHARAAAL